MQVLAIYVSGNGPSKNSLRGQLDHYHMLSKNFASAIHQLDESSIKAPIQGKVQIMPAFENLAGISDEAEGIDSVIGMLSSFQKQLRYIAYISLTWDGENRYGGGVGSDAGLKEDGKRVMEWMAEKKIPLDISHASDYLAFDIFDYVEKKNLGLKVIASHSNFRKVTGRERNLPDEFAKEIIKRKGLIGVNFFYHFSCGKNVRDIFKHIEHGLSLGGGDVLCLGADFFDDETPEYIKKKYGSTRCFYDELPNASCYSTFFTMIQEQTFASEELISKIFHKNSQDFFEQVLHQQKLTV